MALRMLFFDSRVVLCTAILALLVAVWRRCHRHPVPYEGIPLVSAEKGQYTQRTKDILWKGARKFNDAFQVLTDAGPKIFVRAESLIAIDRNLDATDYAKRAFFAHYPGMESIMMCSTNKIFLDTVRIPLTRSLVRLSGPMSDETSMALERDFKGTDEWQQVRPLEHFRKLITQVSCRVFLGEEACKNDEWLDLCVDYTSKLFDGINALSRWPALLQPLVWPFLPARWRLRASEMRGRRIHAQIVACRQAACVEAGYSKKPEDVLQYLENMAAGVPFDYTMAQLALAVAALHTTSQLLTQILFDVCAHPELIDELRREICSALGSGGAWDSGIFHRLKLMDSVMKESQRVNVLSFSPINRATKSPLKLPDGTMLPAGAIVGVSSYSMNNPEIYPDPETWDGARFLKLREQEGNHIRWQFVTPSPEHFGFGLGHNKCPGRFLASHELKIILMHLLLKYEWRAVGNRPANIVRGELVTVNPEGAVEYRERQPEYTFQGSEVRPLEG